MARDGGGVFSKPSGTTAPFASNLISSTTFNTLIDDFVTDANTARPITAGGTGATTASAARTALGVQALDGDLTAIAALGYTSGAYLFKKTAADTYSLITITSAGEAILDDADASAQRTTLGLVIGTNVQAYDADTAKTDVATDWTAAQAIRMRVSAETSGTLTSASANKLLQLTGGITLPNSVFAAGDGLVVDPGTSSRTITRGSGIEMFVNGTDSGTATIQANTIAGVVWRSASICILTGPVS